MLSPEVRRREYRQFLPKIFNGLYFESNQSIFPSSTRPPNLYLESHYLVNALTFFPYFLQTSLDSPTYLCISLLVRCTVSHSLLSINRLPIKGDFFIRVVSDKLGII